MTSPRPSSSVCNGWQRPGSFPEISSASHPGPHPPPFAGVPLWAGAVVLSGLVASVVWLVKPEGKEREEVMGTGKDTLGKKDSQASVKRAKLRKPVGFLVSI